MRYCRPLATVTSEQRPLRKLLILLDIVTSLVAVAAAPWERALVERWLPLRALPPFALWQTEYTILIVLALPIWLALADALDLHDMGERVTTLRALAWRVVQLHVLGFVVLATLLYATQVVLNRSLVGIFLLNSMVGMLAARACVIGWAHYRHRHGTARLRWLLVGAPTGPLAAFARQAQHGELPPHIVGYLAPEQDAEPTSLAIPHLGRLEDLERVLHDEPIDHVFFFRPYVRADELESTLLTCETLGIPASLAVDVGLPLGLVPALSMHHERPFVSLESAPRRPDLLSVKHLLDFVFALCLLLLAAPLLLVVAFAILITMGRPIFYVQDRAGLRGRPFRMAKFRTMTIDADARQTELQAQNEMSGPVFKMTADPRITKLGRVLRKTSIDELPQLLHVLTGAMSLVGPRPLPLSEQQQVRGWHRRRLAMRPGLTGLWQVSGRSDTTFERWMELDLEYVDGWSLWLDAKILLKTIPVVLFQRGAR